MRRVQTTTFILGILIALVVGVLLLKQPRGIGAVHRVDRSPIKIEGNHLSIEFETAKSMKLQSHEIKPITRPLSLKLSGQLMLDPDKLVHITSRFAGEVVSISRSDKGRPISVGQSVEKGQLLATIWSKEVGEKKSDLVDSLSQMYLHQSIYSRLKKISTPGAIPQRSVEEMQRNYESDLIQVERFRRTLESWRVPEHELTRIESEAERIHQLALLDPESSLPEPAQSHNGSNWANTEIRTPISGTILERNLTVGDIVNADVDLFKICDISELIVMANIFEEDIGRILSIPEGERTWSIRVSADPKEKKVVGAIESVGNIIDPAQHTAVIRGRIDNSNLQFRVGQFVEATIEIPNNVRGWEVPIQSVVEVGDDSIIFIARDSEVSNFAICKVQVVRRSHEYVWVQPLDTTLSQADLVLASGAIEVASALPSDWSQSDSIRVR